MNLKLEHIAPRLPYGLNLMVTGDKYEYLSDSNYGKVIGSIIELDCSELEHVELMHEEYWKPILHPLSDLTKEVEHKGEKFVPLVELEIHSDGSNHETEWIEHLHDFDFKLDEVDFEQTPLRLVKILYQWHFDTDNLIENGLAIDVNTLDKNPYV